MKIKKNDKGQALVEFVLILPIIIMILFVIIDMSNVFYNKSHLENVLASVVDEVKQNKTINEIEQELTDEKLNITIKENNNTKTIVLEKTIDFITPFSNNFFKEGYKIKTKRVILNE